MPIPSQGVPAPYLLPRHYPTGIAYLNPMKKPTKAKLQARAADRTAFAEEVRQDYLGGKLEPTRTASGLGYLIHEAGEGKQPKSGQRVEVHYVGLLEDKGAVFEESFSSLKGVRFLVGAGEVIPAWDEAMGLLRWGDEATLFVPSKLGYGPKGRGKGIPPNSNLIFYVEIASVG